MNISPRKDMEGAKTVISVMAISALTNTLSKGQENGDATKVEASGKLEIVNEQTPVIDTKFEKHMVDSSGRRQLPDGEIMKIDMNKDRRKLQKAITAEQEEQKKEEQKEEVTVDALKELYEEQKQANATMMEELKKVQKENAKLIMKQNGTEKTLEENLLGFSKYERK